MSIKYNEAVEEEEDSTEEPTEGPIEREDTEEKEVDFPSDLTVDHHPQRNAGYFLSHDTFGKVDEPKNGDN
ncbi:hypothetical protein HPULCUR_010956 [Helicostylum pulchrum]|uniref:Uncharacterized protein n=1 Tax=Helicostylum pulchrum TaxID=562976 RepID=A0ABP9YEQ1_9FUNG